jgi:hypothetical protein
MFFPDSGNVSGKIKKADRTRKTSGQQDQGEKWYMNFKLRGGLGTLIVHTYLPYTARLVPHGPVLGRENMP